MYSKQHSSQLDYNSCIPIQEGNLGWGIYSTVCALGRLRKQAQPAGAPS